MSCAITVLIAMAKGVPPAVHAEPTHAKAATSSSSADHSAVLDDEGEVGFGRGVEVRGRFGSRQQQLIDASSGAPQS